MESKPNENTSWRGRLNKRFFGGAPIDELGTNQIDEKLLQEFIEDELQSLISQLEVEKEKWERFGDEYSQGKVAAITASQDFIRIKYLQ
jgi:hypothetical protein